MNSTHSLLKENNLTVKIKTLPEMHVASIRHTGDYSRCGEAYDMLCQWADTQNLLNNQTQFLGICYDDPKITPKEKCRYDACIVVDASANVSGEANMQTIPEGRYATVVHKGSYETLYITYAALFGEWLPASGEELKEAPSIQFYLNTVENTPPDELRTELRIALM